MKLVCHIPGGSTITAEAATPYARPTVVVKGELPFDLGLPSIHEIAQVQPRVARLAAATKRTATFEWSGDFERAPE